MFYSTRWTNSVKITVSVVTDDKPHAAFKEVPFSVGSCVIHKQKPSS